MTRAEARTYAKAVAAAIDGQPYVHGALGSWAYVLDVARETLFDYPEESKRILRAAGRMRERFRR